MPPALVSVEPQATALPSELGAISFLNHNSTAVSGSEITAADGRLKWAKCGYSHRYTPHTHTRVLTYMYRNTLPLVRRQAGQAISLRWGRVPHLAHMDEPSLGPLFRPRVTVGLWL